MHKSALVGIFLATLELIRHHRLHADQNELFGEIWLSMDDPNASIDANSVDNYEHGKRA